MGYIVWVSFRLRRHPLEKWDDDLGLMKAAFIDGQVVVMVEKA